MRSARSIVLFGLAAPLLLMQALPASCITTPGGGTGTGVFDLPPTVVMTSNVDRGVAPLTVFFSSSGSSDDGVIIRRDWDFGDGVGTSQEISPTYTYTSTGNFTVRLTLTDDAALTASRSLIIFVTERPVAIIEVDRTIADTAPAVFNFDGSKSFDPDAKPGETLLYTWDFGDGSRELVAVVAHTFASPGTYRVRLTVTDAVGVTGFTETIIEVGIPKPAISFRTPPAGISNIVCSPTSPLWINAAFSVTPGVPFTLRAGLDGDQDICNAEVALFDPTTGQQTHTLTDWTNEPATQQGPVRAAAFSPVPNSARLVAGGDDGAVRLYDTAGGTLLRRYAGTGGVVLALAFAPDGASFAAGYSDGALIQWQAASDTVVRPFLGHTAAVDAVAFSADGSQLMAGDESGMAILWSVADGSQAFTFDHAGAAVTSVAFSPANAQRVLTGSSDRTARVWSTINGHLTEEFAPVFNNGTLVAGHSDAITSVAYSPDGTLVATGSADKTAQLWDVATGSKLRTLSAHTDAVTGVGFSPDGKQLVTSSADHTAMLWDVATGNQLRTLQPCLSPITAASFSPDGNLVALAVAAQNDLQLDTNPSSGNDLNLTLPTALQLTKVPTGATGREFSLWVELRTDRSTPSRTYSTARVNVIPEFTATLDPTTPMIPLRNGVANVVLPPTNSQRVFDLGQLDVGDRIFLSLLSLPGYGETFSQIGLDPLALAPSPGHTAREGFSVLILDADEKMFAWYEAGRVFFTPDSKLIIGHSSTGYFFVLAATPGEFIPSVNIRIQRQFLNTSGPRQQFVHLNFGGGTGIAVGGSSEFNISPFAVTGHDATVIRTAIVARVTDMLAPYNFVVSETPPAVSTQPHLTIYFDVDGRLLLANPPDRDNDGLIQADDLYMWGLPDYIDPRDATLSGRAVVAVKDIVNSPLLAALADGQIGLAIGNSAVHLIGLMCGLRETTQPPGLIDDVMTEDMTQVVNAGLVFTTADLAPSGDIQPIGVQDAPELLNELFGPH
jgi:WD40 repeat protein